CGSNCWICSTFTGRITGAGASLIVVVLLQRRETAREIVQVLEAGCALAPLAVVLQRGAGGILTRLAYRVRDQALGGNGNPVGQFQMAQHAGIAADLAPAADPGAAGHCGAAG